MPGPDDNSFTRSRSEKTKGIIPKGENGSLSKREKDNFFKGSTSKGENIIKEVNRL
jgi:hypothetical protein